MQPNEHTPAPVLLYQNGKPFIGLNEIHTIFEKVKNGTDTLIDTIVGAALSKDQSENNFLGIQVNEKYRDKIKVIIFDTENGETKATQRLSIIHKALGITEANPLPPGTLKMVSLRNEVNKDRLMILEVKIKEYSFKYPDYHFLICWDSMADFISNSGDVEEIVLFWEKLLSINENHRTTFITTMHKSKNGTSLGHMGTYAEKSLDGIFELRKFPLMSKIHLYDFSYE